MDLVANTLALTTLNSKFAHASVTASLRMLRRLLSFPKVVRSHAWQHSTAPCLSVSMLPQDTADRAVLLKMLTSNEYSRGKLWVEFYSSSGSDKTQSWRNDSTSIFTGNITMFNVRFPSLHVLCFQWKIFSLPFCISKIRVDRASC